MLSFAIAAALAAQGAELPSQLPQVEVIGQRSDIVAQRLDLGGLARDDLHEGRAAVSCGEHGVLPLHAPSPRSQHEGKDESDQGHGADDEHASLRIPGHRSSLVGNDATTLGA